MLANHSEYIVDVLNGATEVEITCKRGGRRYTTSGLKLTPLVRCKECKWRDDGNGANRALICTNEYIDIDCHPDFYCGYGKREDE